MKSLSTLSTLAALVAGVAAGPAAAQLAPNSSAPVDITADQLEVVNAQCEATWSGNAEALQDTSRLRADVLKIFNKPGAAKPGSAQGSSCGVLEHMEAHGSVYYVTPQQRVRSNDAVYRADSSVIVMTGDVVAAQGQNVLRGEKMTINTKTGAGQMEASAKGRNKAGRVRGVFYPNQGQAQNPPSAKSKSGT
jgi:lipopolysaccharide export system protein LptA